MASTTYVDGTVVPTAWLNDVNTVVYNDAGGPGVLGASTGATKVGSINIGTGAVSRTVQSKLQDWISVLDFNAKGDGSTDDGPAFQNALNAAQDGDVVYVPASDLGYKISTQITWPTTKNISLIGFGVKLTINVAIGIKINNLGSGYAAPAARLDGFYFYSNTTGSNTAIQISDSIRTTVMNCKIVFFNKGIELKNVSSFTEETLLAHINLQHNNYGLYFDASSASLKSLATTRLDHISISMANASASQPFGIYIVNGTDIYRAVWTDVVIFLDKNTAVGLFHDGKMQGLSGTLHFENNLTYTGLTAISIGANAVDNAINLYCNFTGTIATPITFAGANGPWGFRGVGSAISSDYRFHMQRFNDWFLWTDPATGILYTKSGAAPTTATNGTKIGSQ